VVHGKGPAGREILGKLNTSGDMAFLELDRKGRRTRKMSKPVQTPWSFTLVEHGVHARAALAARLTYLGAPEAMQAAVAARPFCGPRKRFSGRFYRRAWLRLFNRIP